MSKVKDKKAAKAPAKGGVATEEEIDDAAATAEAADGAEGAETESDDGAVDHKAEAERLRRENEELRRERETRHEAPAPAAPRVTTATLDALTKAQREELEEQTGKTFDEIYRRVQANEAQSSSQSIQARLNVADALESAAERDPKVHRLKKHMRDYLNDLPESERADSARLERHVAKAKTYATGKLAESGTLQAPDARRQPARVRDHGPEGEDGGAGDEGGDGDEIRAGDERVVDGMRLKVSPLGGRAAKRAQDIRHPRDPNGVMFRGAGEQAFDKPPVFGRGE